MKNLLLLIKQNRYFLTFLLLFAYAQSIHSRIAVGRTLNIYLFTPEAAIATLFSVCFLFLIIIFFIKKWQKSGVLAIKSAVKIFGSSILVYFLSTNFLGLIIALIFGNFERNFNQETFILSNSSNLLDGFIYGSFFLAYYYYQNNQKHQLQLATYHQALSESKINQLKAQLNPHFLFNNLNILDQLIEEDKHQASHFLNQFADIYRYVLQASDKKLIPLSKEIEFGEQYFSLIKYKYGNAYQLIIEGQNEGGLIVPLTLQLLIENALQHNLGSVSNPVLIKVKLDTMDLIVSNNLINKRNQKTTSGRALNNLKEQYNLLDSSRKIEIKKSETSFSVIIPIIYSQEV